LVLKNRGLITCYELRFAELTRILALQGAQLIIVPAAWVAGRMKEEHLSVLARARALENTVFVCVACQTGRMFTGRRTIIDPFGVPLCDAGEEEGLTVTDVDLGRVERVRRTLGSLHHLRADVLRNLYEAKMKS
jgi:predicted amidohydrolase